MLLFVRQKIRGTFINITPRNALQNGTMISSILSCLLGLLGFSLPSCFAGLAVVQSFRWRPTFTIRAHLILHHSESERIGHNKCRTPDTPRDTYARGTLMPFLGCPPTARAARTEQREQSITITKPSCSSSLALLKYKLGGSKRHPTPVIRTIRKPCYIYSISIRKIGTDTRYKA